MAKLVDAQVSEACGNNILCRFDSGSRHPPTLLWSYGWNATFLKEAYNFTKIEIEDVRSVPALRSFNEVGSSVEVPRRLAKGEALLARNKKIILLAA